MPHWIRLSNGLALPTILTPLSPRMMCAFKSEKPDSHIFNYTLATIGVSAEEAVHVGDTYEADVIGAKNVGIRPILIDRDSTQIGRWKDTIQNLAEIIGIA